jgi:hypothetical protein
VRPGGAARLAIVASLSIAACISAGLENAYAQTSNAAQPAAADKPDLGWSNTSDLSLVLTEGNSNSTTLGFTDQLNHVWKDARFEFEVNVVHSMKSDDRYFQVDPGLEFPVGGAPSNPSTTLVRPEPDLDVANYLLRGTYEKNITGKWFWNTGLSWYRNDDAGIRHRYIGFGGLGNTWADNKRRRFVTSYGVAYVDRKEIEPDAEKDRRFGAARASWDYTEHLNAATTFDSDLSATMNFADASDYQLNTINALTVSANSRVSIKVSLQLLFENEPALEDDLDVVAYVETINPDGLPGTGDERFRTLSSGGTKLVLGKSNARKDKLDTVVRTALVIKF